ncbi:MULTISPECIES: hypothetical protein [Bacillaceae]|uniref:Uncharacterized protein n=1 Tax=Evansella alkalicola TaxID=745819 RepID=A0ABS6JT36_9BACI|nr:MULTISPECIES: hypothetical protein [Bacillaceae]MBU9721736.1 hypothetical protein [Bacillus alkalicola]
MKRPQLLETEITTALSFLSSPMKRKWKKYSMQESGLLSFIYIQSNNIIRKEKEATPQTLLIEI